VGLYRLKYEELGSWQLEDMAAACSAPSVAAALANAGNAFYTVTVYYTVL
jgi:hypothetical protein